MNRLFGIRPASWDDLPAIKDLQADALRRLATAFYEPEIIEAFIAFGTMETFLLEDRTYFVAERGPRIVATGGWTFRRPGYEEQTVKEENESPSDRLASVRSLFVHPDEVRQGLASALMHHIECEMAAAGCSQAQLTSSLSGIPLYRRLGWRSGEGVTIALPKGSKLLCLRMTKDLPRPMTRAA